MVGELMCTANLFLNRIEDFLGNSSQLVESSGTLMYLVFCVYC